MTPTRRRRILLDLDGFIANFDKHFLDVFGIHPEAFDDNDQFWKTFDTKPTGFFRGIPLFVGAREFVEKIFLLADKYNCEVAVLTAIPRKSTAPTAEREKNEWVIAQKFSRALQVLIGPHAIQKQNHARPGDVLADDNAKNIEQWVSKGGIGVLHEGDYDKTYSEIEMALSIGDVNAIRVYQASRAKTIEEELVSKVEK